MTHKSLILCSSLEFLFRKTRWEKKKDFIPIIERKALASAGLTLLSSSEASHTYSPMSTVVGLTMVRRRPKEPTPLATSTPFLLHTKLSLSTGLARERKNTARGKETKRW